MNVDYEGLVKKILEFWNLYDGLDITTEILKKYFSAEEIFTLFYDSNFKHSYYVISNRFDKKCANLKGLFTTEEALRLKNYLTNPFELLEYYDDETLIPLIEIDDSYLPSIAENLSNDEAREKLLKMVKGTSEKIDVISAFESDELKLKYLNKIPLGYKSVIIRSIEDEFLKEKFIGLFKGDISSVVSSLSDDQKKLKYYKRYYLTLNNFSKGYILSSLDDPNLILECLKRTNDYVKCEVLRTDTRLNEEQKYYVLSTMTNRKQIAQVLLFANIDTKTIMQFIDLVTDSKDIADIIRRLSDSEKILFLGKCGEKQKIEILKDIYEPECMFDGFKYLTKFSSVVHVLEHAEIFPKYKEEYEYIIDLYASNYNLNKEHLLVLVQQVSLGVLRVIKNENIRKIINSNDDDFNKLVSLFSNDKKEMNAGAMNDVLNSLLQREFRVKYSEIRLIFPAILNAIENKDKELIVQNLNKLSEDVNVSEELEKNNISMNAFVELLLSKNEDAINILHNLTTRYIRSKRNSFIKDNLDGVLKKCAIERFETKDLVKHAINNFPVEFIMSLLPSEKVNSEDDIEYLYTDLEYEFLANRELIKRIILYKKNPLQYETIPEDVKANLRTFNNVMVKALGKMHIKFPDNENLRRYYEFRETSEDNIVNILMNLDMDKMKKGIFSNPEMFEFLNKLLTQYKIVGWGEMFLPMLSQCGMVVDSEIIANFIQYFNVSYEELKQKVEAGSLGNISLTALLDLANCYSMESRKYSLLFGNEDFKLIAGNPGPNSSSMVKKDRIAKAINLMKTIRERDYVTVPPVDQDFKLRSGKSMNIVVGNFSNPINLTYGERTGACMRIGGAGDSLFKFCLEDENGFHVRFVNPQTGAFVSRVSGFRNGNTVFLNQLRDSVNSEYTNSDVVEACKKIAEEMIRLSQDSPVPIDNVVVSPYYAMGDSGMPVENLGISNPQKGMKQFYTDVSATSIVLASSSPDGKLVPVKLGNRGLKKYLVQRDKQRILYDKEASEYLLHLKIIDQVLNGVNIDVVDSQIKDDILLCYAGEDWCVYVTKGGGIEHFIMNNSNNKEKAIDEMQTALEHIKNNLSNEINLAENVSLGM